MTTKTSTEVPAEPPRRRRILVALDADPDSLALLDEAAAMATALQAELAAVFVEDENLLRLSELPGLEISFTTGRPRSTSLGAMERELRAQAAEARRRLELIAARSRLAWSFEVRRCAWAQAILDAAATADIIATGRSGQGPSRGLGFATGRRPSATGSRRHGVMALYEDGATSVRVLDFAIHAAKALDTGLTILLPDGDAATTERYMSDIARQLSEAETRARVVRLPGDRAALLAGLKQLRPHLLLLDSAGPLASSGRLRQALDAADCKVMLVSPR